MEDTLWQKTTFNGRRPSGEDDLQWKTTSYREILRFGSAIHRHCGHFLLENPILLLSCITLYDSAWFLTHLHKFCTCYQFQSCNVPFSVYFIWFPQHRLCRSSVQQVFPTTLHYLMMMNLANSDCFATSGKFKSQESWQDEKFKTR